MKISFWTLCLLSISLTSVGQQPTEFSIIPQPVSIEKKGGSFELNSYSIIEVPDKTPDVQRVSRFLAQQLLRSTGFPIRVQLAGDPKDNRGTTIAISLNRKPDAVIGAEGYTLEVASSLVILRANQPAGLFYGVQTLLQLFPKEIESASLVKKPYWTVPGCKIMDYPRFGWRGLMLDVSRHFYSKVEVFRFIDDMVKYKYNVLHWHLTDDQGWRIEIKSLPKLTEVGAWRVPRVGRMSLMSAPTADEPRTYGGFYTQDDIKEVVQYAKDRFVNVLPEIEMPGHSMATVASYPELSGTPGTYRVNSGEKFMNWHSGGFDAIIDNTLGPANEKVYEFAEKVFSEVAQLFPFEYIHMGGDECAKNFWNKSEAVKQLMQKEKLKDMHEVQSYFVKRIEKIIESKGKKMMGWDEILEGGLAPNAAVMSWRGDKGGIEASKLNHKVVMTPNAFVYLDFNQGEATVEPPIYANLRLSKTYQFEPVPEGANAAMILGGQGNLWTEQVPSLRAAQYMIWPRGMAIAEDLWSPKEKKNWNEFVVKVEKHFERLDVAQTKYARTIYDPIITAKKSKDSDVVVTLATEIEGLEIFYSWDETHPDNFYPKFTQPITLPKDALHLKVITYRNGKPMGRQIDITTAELKKRAGVK
ncbi:MAG: family 20 glycosylhydrolase [Chitinophagaceae bacterium]|nr:family 20 glycosylhydrolase [Chitinophagaceae bacterium]